MMLLYKPPGNHQSDARTGFLKIRRILRTIVFMKNISLLLFRNTDARIRHFNCPFLLHSFHNNMNNTLLRIFQCIGKQIVYNMIHFPPVNPYFRHIGIYV